MKTFYAFILYLLSVAACSSSTVSQGQNLASPVHLVPEANAAMVADFNSQGLGVCSSGDFTLAIEWAGETGRDKVAEVHHQGQLGAAAYGWGHDDDGWYVERMDDSRGAQLYPAPFAACASPASMRAPVGRTVLWREGQGQ